MCSPADALTEAFVKTDIEFRKELEFFRKSKKVKQKDWHPGCTAVVALVVRDRLFVANAGDCRTILCRAGNPIVLSKVSFVCVYFFLSFSNLFIIFCVLDISDVINIIYQDHVASCLEERERVISAGGQVKWQVDTWRVGPAALQVSFKHYENRDPT